MENDFYLYNKNRQKLFPFSEENTFVIDFTRGISNKGAKPDKGFKSKSWKKHLENNSNLFINSCTLRFFKRTWVRSVLKWGECHWCFNQRNFTQGVKIYFSNAWINEGNSVLTRILLSRVLPRYSYKPL